MKKYFLGHEVSEYGLKNGYVDYGCLSEGFNMILANDIAKRLDHFTLYNGEDYDVENECYHDIYQWFIIDERAAEVLKEYTDEIVYEDEELGLYIWAVTHYGTSWSYVLTNIKIE